jgi:hypothetical protein
LEFSTPVGRRYAQAQARNLELQLAKARVALQQQEVEISHELAAAFRDVDRTYLAMRNAFNRIDAAEARLEAVLGRTLPEDLSVDPLLRAHEARLDAELEFLAAVTDYNTALADLHYRAARTLEVNAVHLSEGPWCPEAREDAARRHDARSHAFSAGRKLTATPPFERDVPAGEILLPALTPEPTPEYMPPAGEPGVMPAPEVTGPLMPPSG